MMLYPISTWQCSGRCCRIHNFCLILHAFVPDISRLRPRPRWQLAQLGPRETRTRRCLESRVLILITAKPFKSPGQVMDPTNRKNFERLHHQWRLPETRGHFGQPLRPMAGVMEDTMRTEGHTRPKDMVPTAPGAVTDRMLHQRCAHPDVARRAITGHWRNRSQNMFCTNCKASLSQRRPVSNSNTASFRPAKSRLPTRNILRREMRPHLKGYGASR